MEKNSTTIVLYSTPEHLNSISNLAALIAERCPSISVVMLSTAAVSDVAAAPAIAYRRLPTPEIPRNLASVDHLELSYETARLNNQNLERALVEIAQRSEIKAMIIDFFCNSAFEVSTRLSIPTYFCNTTGAFGLCVLLHWPTVHEKIVENSSNGYDDVIEIEIEVPGCPTIKSSDLPRSMILPHSNSNKHIVGTAMNMRRSAGIIVNTFHALESRAMEALANGLCVPDGPNPPVYSLGPMIGGGAAGEHECLRWLDLQPSKSVVFLCFGRGGVFSTEQLREMAIGLENSGCRFLWAVRGPPEEPNLEALLPDGFLGRINDSKRGFVLKGWAPQTAVLSHGSVGGFVTHCGQSSVLEAVACGVPMAGWPLYAEQRMNRVFMVEEMKVSVAKGMAAAEEDGLVTAEEVERGVRELMESRRGIEVRRRVAEMKHSAAAAVREGGSSVVALETFMETVIT